MVIWGCGPTATHRFSHREKTVRIHNVVVSCERDLTMLNRAGISFWQQLVKVTAVCGVLIAARRWRRTDGGINGAAAFHRHWAASERLPFSFVYGGRSSSELLGKWKRTVEESTIDATRVRAR